MNTQARRGQTITTEWGTTFKVTSVRNAENPNTLEVEKAAYGINDEDGTEHGPYFVSEYIVN